MYLNEINQEGTTNVISGFGNIFICTDPTSSSDPLDDTKTITVPFGYNPAQDTNISLKVVFQNGHNCVDSSTPLKLKLKYPDNTYVVDGNDDPLEIAVKVNKDGSLITLPIHTMTVGGTTYYKSLQANTLLDMYYDGTDFVVIGNPLVLSSVDYNIYANGYIEGGYVGDVKAISYSTIPSYGWLECNGQVVLQSDYPQLYQKFSDDNLLTVYNANHTGLDTATQFAIPDYREVALVGVGQNDSEGTALATHDIYTVGEFKDDLIKNHKHNFGRYDLSYGSPEKLIMGGSSLGMLIVYPDTSNNYGGGDVNRGKRKGVKYIIKVL